MTRSKTVQDVQHDFNKEYPYLRLDFYRKTKSQKTPGSPKKLPGFTTLDEAGLLCEGELMVGDQMTVGQLEMFFADMFGINVQVARQSGSLWLETTMTDGWTLFQQNEHGRELSQPIPKTEPEIDRDVF